MSAPLCFESVASCDNMDNLPPLLEGSEWLEHDGRRLASPPKPVGHERDLARAEESRKQLQLRQETYPNREPDQIITPQPHYFPPILRAQAPVFTYSTPAKRSTDPTIPKALFIEVSGNSKVVGNRRSGRPNLKKTDKKKVRWEGNGGVGSFRPPTIPERFCKLVGRKWEPRQTAVTSVKEYPISVTSVTRVAIPWIYESPQKK